MNIYSLLTAYVEKNLIIRKRQNIVDKYYEFSLIQGQILISNQCYKNVSECLREREQSKSKE